MKIIVYAIAKDESQNVDRWMDSMSEADGVYVLDTGSSDDTVQKLRERGAVVNEKTYKTFRFDKARNDSLDLVPLDADVCVCTDLDETFVDGWRKEIESSWQSDNGKLTFRYTFDFDADGKEQTVFFADKIHSREGWRWKYPVHEVLSRVGSKPFRCNTNSNIKLLHHPTKKERDYLPLLKMQVAEIKDEARGYYYLAREYFLMGEIKLALDTFKHYFSLKSATWNEERSSAYRFMAVCSDVLSLGSADDYYMHAIIETPSLREPYVDYAQYLMSKQKWYGAIHFLSVSLSLSTPSLAFAMDSSCYRSLPYDLLSLCYYSLSDKENARLCCEKALSFDPSSSRLLANLKLFS